MSGNLGSDGFVQTRSASPLTQDNLSRHSIHIDDRIDRYSQLDIKMERYHASVRNAASFDLSDSDESPLRRKKGKRSAKKEVDLVLSPPRPLAFPFHNDSLFLPVVETEPAKQTQLGHKSKHSADNGTLRSSAPKTGSARANGSIRTHGTTRSLPLFRFKNADDSPLASTPRSDILKRTLSFATDRSNPSANSICQKYRVESRAETQQPILHVPSTYEKPLPAIPVPERVSHDEGYQQQSDSIIVKLYRFLKLTTNKQSKSQKQSVWSALRVL